MFNQQKPPKAVAFIPAWVIICKAPIGEPHKAVLAAEPYIDVAKFKKHNSNFGFVSRDARNTPQAFSHFSWEYSEHRFMIVDIQVVVDLWCRAEMVEV